MNAFELWKKACAHLKRALHDDVYLRWIETIKPSSICDNQFILHVDNDFCQTWLENHYQQVIEEALLSAGAPRFFGSL